MPNPFAKESPIEGPKTLNPQPSASFMWVTQPQDIYFAKFLPKALFGNMKPEYK